MAALEVLELINRRRRQILVHSVIYYRLNSNLISDYTFDQWCNELVLIQNQHPELSKQGVFYKYFKDFDGSSGYDLPLSNEWAVNKALQLLRISKGVKHV